MKKITFGKFTPWGVRANFPGYLLTHSAHPGREFVIAQGSTSRKENRAAATMCDTPRCNNPRHLFVGSPATNAADREQKGRGNQPKGERAAKSRLTELQVREVLASPLPYSAIARQYGVTKENIAAIKQRRTWRHLS